MNTADQTDSTEPATTMSHDAPTTTLPAPPDWADDLAQRHADSLLRYAYSLCHDRDTAREAVQETFLRLVRQEPASLNGHEAPWLFRVCRTRVLDIARKESRMKKTPIDSAEAPATDALPEKAASPARAAELADTARMALVHLAALPQNQQEVVRLKFQNGLSYKEIADVTELSVSHVGVLLHSALKTLRQKMAATL